MITQGQYEIVNGNVYGCPVPSNCKVQVRGPFAGTRTATLVPPLSDARPAAQSGGQQGTQYFDLAGQRTRFDSPGGSIVTLFATPHAHHARPPLLTPP